MKLDISLLLNEKIKELELVTCECVPSIDEFHEPIKCHRCIELEKLRTHCKCGKCQECLEFLRNAYLQRTCSCTYRIAKETQPDGTAIDVEVLDVKCERCIELDAIDKTLSEYQLYEDAYLPKNTWLDCYYMNGVIYTPLYENGILVKNGKQIYEEKQPNLKFDIISELNSYKHEYITWITYDGHKQRFTTDDKMTMLDCQQSLEQKLKTNVTWKYIDGYVEVTDPKYFVNMRLAGGNATEKAFKVEAILSQEIGNLNPEQLKVYDLKRRFDEVFKTL